MAGRSSAKYKPYCKMTGKAFCCSSVFTAFARLLVRLSLQLRDGGGLCKSALQGGATFGTSITEADGRVKEVFCWGIYNCGRGAPCSLDSTRFHM
jgi:hypothetical protein